MMALPTRPSRNFFSFAAYSMFPKTDLPESSAVDRKKRRSLPRDDGNPRESSHCRLKSAPFRKNDEPPAAFPEASLPTARNWSPPSAARSPRGGWIPFARFMELTLTRRVLATTRRGAKVRRGWRLCHRPEMSAFSGRALARQVAQVMEASQPSLLEVGAGSGRLAADLLLWNSKRSGDRRSVTRSSICPPICASVSRRRWPPHCISAAARALAGTSSGSIFGVVVANEVLDAMPPITVAWRDDGTSSAVSGSARQAVLVWFERPATGALLAAAERSVPNVACRRVTSEIGLAARAWAAEWGHRLQVRRAVADRLWLSAPRVYHQQRGRGTLMCHYRHHAHPDPFHLPGLQDVTVHADFTAIIAAAHAAGLDLLGYASQGQFLLNCGIPDLLARSSRAPRIHPRQWPINQMLMPHEMVNCSRSSPSPRHRSPVARFLPVATRAGACNAGAFVHGRDAPLSILVHRSHRTGVLCVIPDCSASPASGPAVHPILDDPMAGLVFIVSAAALIGSGRFRW